MKLYLKKRFGVEIHSKDDIIKACNEILKKYNFEEINNVAKLALTTDYFNLIFMEKSEVTEYDEWYNHNKDRKIERSEIKNIELEKQEYQSQRLRKSKSEQTIPFQ
jgi:hypothetical protein